MSRKTLILSNMLLVVFAATAWACLWDSDTLQMERQRFPGVLEIITGKFVRHSRAYYEWRIVDRKKKLETQPDDPALLDDLAVAYAKLGRPEEGIALLEPTLASHPDRYETLSNLGTLLFFAGRLDESKQYIRRALEINPNAHFDRERYQLLLTEYLQQSNYSITGVMRGDKLEGFDKKVLSNCIMVGADSDIHREQRLEIEGATRGVLGMMHFANFESPILLEALGDLLCHGYEDEDATLLACRAYLRAAQFSSNPSAAEQFRQRARHSLLGYLSPLSLEGIQEELQQELKTSGAWAERIEANERRWIAEGRDVDREFAAVYYESLESTIAAAAEDSKLPPAVPYDPSAAIPLENPWLAPVAGVALAIAFVAILLRWRRGEPLASKPR